MYISDIEKYMRQPLAEILAWSYDRVVAIDVRGDYWVATATRPWGEPVVEPAQFVGKLQLPRDGPLPKKEKVAAFMGDYKWCVEYLTGDIYNYLFLREACPVLTKTQENR